YLVLRSDHGAGEDVARPASVISTEAGEHAVDGSAPPAIDRTPKLYIGGKQARPDQGYSLFVRDAGGRTLGEVPRGNRKDIRNAVEAAHGASGWSRMTAHARAQVLYYIAENLDVRRDEFVRRLGTLTGSEEAANREFDHAVRAAFTWAAWADKWEGAVHPTPFRNVPLAMKEPIGVLGIVCMDAAPLLGFLSPVLAAIATGNTVVA